MSFLEPFIKDRPPPENEEVVFVEDKWERSSSSKVPGSTNRITASLEREHLLIDLIRRYEVIYNTKCSEYRYAKERHAAWVEIADLHGSSGKKSFNITRPADFNQFVTKCIDEKLSGRFLAKHLDRFEQA